MAHRTPKSEDLLSAEELKLLSHLQISGLAQQITSKSTNDLFLMHENDMRAAIASLKESTTAIEKSSERLESQWSLLESLRESRNEAAAKGERQAGLVARKQGLELQQLDLITREEGQALSAGIETASIEAARASTTMPHRLKHLLTLDDRQLEHLQSQTAAVHHEEDGGQAALSRISKLSGMLIEFTCEELQTRLDRVYLDQMGLEVSTPDGINKTDSISAVELQNDLDTLYAEIRDVVTMSVKQEYEAPLIDALGEEQRQQRNTNAESARSALTILQGLSRGLSDAAVQVEEHISYCHALADVRAITKSCDTSRAPLTSPATSEDVHETITSEALRRHVGVHAECSVSSDELVRILKSRRMKLQQTMPRSVLHETAVGEIEASDQLRQILSPALSNYNTETRSSLDALDAHITQVGDDVQDIDLASVGERNKSQQEFVRRWT